MHVVNIPGDTQALYCRKSQPHLFETLSDAAEDCEAMKHIPVHWPSRSVKGKTQKCKARSHRTRHQPCESEEWHEESGSEDQGLDNDAGSAGDEPELSSDEENAPGPSVKTAEQQARIEELTKRLRSDRSPNASPLKVSNKQLRVSTCDA